MEAAAETPDDERLLIGGKIQSEPFLNSIAMPEPQEESEIEGVIVAAIEAFCAWDGKSPAPTVSFEARYKSRQISLANACGLVWNCSDILPDSVFRDVVALCDFAGLLPVMNREVVRLTPRCLRRSCFWPPPVAALRKTWRRQRLRLVAGARHSSYFLRFRSICWSPAARFCRGENRAGCSRKI